MSFVFLRGLSLGTCILSLTFIACDSDVADDDSEAGATSGGGDGPSGSGASSGQGGSGGATASSGSVGSGGAPSDCANVPKYIENLYAAASACAPADPSLHCQDVVDGFCCPVLVESINSPETQAYLDFLDLSRDECPEMWETCETVKCGQPPVGSCVPDQTRAGGHCMPD